MIFLNQLIQLPKQLTSSLVSSRASAVVFTMCLEDYRILGKIADGNFGKVFIIFLFSLLDVLLWIGLYDYEYHCGYEYYYEYEH